MLCIKQCASENIIEESRNGIVLISKEINKRARYFSIDGRFDLVKERKTHINYFSRMFEKDLLIEFMEEV